jgi:hypothetical protein
MSYPSTILSNSSLTTSLLRYGWVIFFLIACYAFYEQGLRIRNHDFDKLYDRFLQLEMEKKEALAIQEDLLLQINSQSDPEWVELTLKKVLGLISQEETKIYFGN